MMSSNQKLRVPPNIKHQFIFIEILSMLAKRAYDESAVFKQIHHCKCSTNTPVILDPFVASPHLIAVQKTFTTTFIPFCRSHVCNCNSPTKWKLCELLQYQSVIENELELTEANDKDFGPLYLQWQPSGKPIWLQCESSTMSPFCWPYPETLVQPLEFFPSTVERMLLAKLRLMTCSWRPFWNSR